MAIVATSISSEIPTESLQSLSLLACYCVVWNIPNEGTTTLFGHLD